MADALGTNGSVEQLAAGAARPTDNMMRTILPARGRHAMRGQLNPKHSNGYRLLTPARKDPKLRWPTPDWPDAQLAHV